MPSPYRSPSLRRGILLLATAAFVLSVLATCVVLVDETEYVLVERFGEIVAVYDRPDDRGLRFKLPWPVETARRFDRRIRLFDSPARELFTSDKKNVTVEAYICWRIAEPASDGATDLGQRPVVRFFRGLGGLDVAEQRLDSRVRSVLSSQLGQVEFSRLFSVTDSEQGPDGDAGPLDELSASIRRQVERQPGEDQPFGERTGVEIVDVRIRRVNLPEGNRPAVYERMRSERRKIADRYRSAGLAENRVIRSQADRQAAEILARSKADAERIRGEGEAEALRILNEAHALDRELARVLQTLDAYQAILNSKTTLVLSASGRLFRLLTEGIPESDVPPAADPPTERVSRAVPPQPETER